MKNLFIALVLTILFAGTAGAADFSQFLGTWVYTSVQMDQISKITIQGSGKYNAHVWEKCSSGTCDYGGHNCNAVFSTGKLNFSYDSNSGDKQVWLRVTGTNTLEVKVNSNTYTFRRFVLKPASPRPVKPMDRVSPRPAPEPTGKY